MGTETSTKRVIERIMDLEEDVEKLDRKVGTIFDKMDTIRDTKIDTDKIDVARDTLIDFKFKILGIIASTALTATTGAIVYMIIEHIGG